MARRRMFSLDIVDTDAFLDMPTSAQALYFHLGMHGDDDGFVGSPRKIVRGTGCAESDLNLLTENGFIIPFESGVIVIRAWKVNNSLKNDRYKETIYQTEKGRLTTDKSGCYVLGSISETRWNHNEQTNEQNVAEQSRTSAPQKREGEREGEPPITDEIAADRSGGESLSPEQEFEEKRRKAIELLNSRTPQSN